MDEKPWTTIDATRLRDAIGEMRWRYGPQWGYFELARYFPAVDHAVLVAGRDGPSPLADAHADMLRHGVQRILSLERPGAKA